MARAMSPCICPPTRPRRHLGRSTSWCSDARAAAIVAAVLSSAAPAPARAQHEHEDSPLGVPLARTGSGTAWLPDAVRTSGTPRGERSEEHTSELQSRLHLVCRLLLEKKKQHT